MRASHLRLSIAARQLAWRVAARVSWRLISSFALLLTLAAQGEANAAVVDFANERGSQSIIERAEVFVDACACLTVAQVTQMREGWRAASKADFASRERRRSALWLRWSMENTLPEAQTRLLLVEPRAFDHITLFERRGDAWAQYEAGAEDPRDARVLRLPAPAFNLEVGAGQEKTVLLRLSGTGLFWFRVQLATPMATIAQAGAGGKVFGILLGAHLATIGLLILQWLVMKHREFAYLAFTALAQIFYGAWVNGFLAGVWHPSAVGSWTQACALVLALDTAAWVQFARIGLRLNMRFPRFDKFLLIVCGVLVIAAIAQQIASVFFAIANATAFSCIALSVVLSGAAAVVLRNGRLDRIERGVAVCILLSTLAIFIGVYQVVSNSDGFPPIPEEMLAPVLRMIGYLVIGAILLFEWSRRENARRQMIAFVGHDLRAPILSVLNAVRNMGIDGGAEKRWCRVAELAADQQIELIDELVEYAREDHGGLALELAPCHLHGLLRDIEREGDVLAQRRNNVFRLSAASDLPGYVFLDRRRVAQILRNLLSNAAKFTADGNIDLSVGARPVHMSNRCELIFSVADSGIGIAREDLGNLFKPFWRRESSSAGSGLGLTIARKWALALGGALDVESRIGRGSTFVLKLTVELAKESDLHVVDDVETYAPPIGAGLTVLVVDDHAATRAQIEQRLMLADFEVFSAADCATALRFIQHDHIDLLVTDQLMPDGNGWEVLAAFRARFGEQATAILYSSMPPVIPAAWGRARTFDANLMKPLSNREWWDEWRRIAALKMRFQTAANAAGASVDVSG